MPKPKKLAPKKVGEKKVEKHVHHLAELDEHGNVIKEGYTEVVEEVVDVIEMVYQEMTDEEVAKLEKQQDLPHVPTLEERVTELERIVAELTAKPKPKPKP